MLSVPKLFSVLSLVLAISSAVLHASFWCGFEVILPIFMHILPIVSVGVALGCITSGLRGAVMWIALIISASTLLSDCVILYLGHFYGRSD